MLSILIPSYNHSRYVVEAIASARRVSLPGTRVIVIDDASTDESVEVIKEYLSREGCAGVEFIAKPVNKGAIDSVNQFLSMCTTEYVYFMASDDVVIAEGIERLVRLMEKKNRLQFAIGGGHNVFADGRRTELYGPKHHRFFALSQGAMRKALFLDCPSPILCQSSVFRLSAINAVNGFDGDMIADDFALFTKLLMKYGKKGEDFEFAPETACVLYRHHGVNSYRNLPRQSLATMQVLEVLTPRDLRPKAVGYKLAYYALVALSRRDFSAAKAILGMAPRYALGWFLAGLGRHSLNKVLSR